MSNEKEQKDYLGKSDSKYNYSEMYANHNPLRAKSTEKTEKFCTTIPTGFHLIDIMLGENKRSLDGDIVDIWRGFMATGKQFGLAAEPGIGKSTLIAQIMSHPLKVGMQDCIHKIYLIDTDNGAWDNYRVRKLTNLPFDVIDEKFEIVQLSDVNEIASFLAKESKEFNKLKLKPVTFFDHYMQMERKMQPVVMVIIDTMTSLVNTDVDEATAKQQGMTVWLDTGNLINNMGSFFNGNHATIWTMHLKDKKKEPGQYAAEREFKAMPANKTTHAPRRFREKASGVLLLKNPKAGLKIDATEHPKNKYMLMDKEGMVFTTDAIQAKSRTGAEGQTVCTLCYYDNMFQHSMSMVISCLNAGIIQEGSGMFPSAEHPSIFKGQEDCENEIAIMGRKTKRTLMIPGHDRPTNILEVRLILDYTGTNTTIIDEKIEIFSKLYSAMQEHFSYELEGNNITGEELKKKNLGLFQFLPHVSLNMSKKTITREIVDKNRPENADELTAEAKNHLEK